MKIAPQPAGEKQAEQPWAAGIGRVFFATGKGGHLRTTIEKDQKWGEGGPGAGASYELDLD